VKQKKLYSILTAGLVSVAAVSGITPARAATINFDFYSTSVSAVKGTIAFDDSVTTPGQVPGKPTVATYWGSVESYSITNGNLSFSGNTIGFNQINLHNNTIDINDSINRTYAGDGIEFLIGDGDTFLILRFLYPNTTVLNSLSLSDISLRNAIASQAPQLPLPGSSFGGAIFTFLQVSNSSGYAIQDGTYFGSDFVTSTSIPEPSTILGSLLATGILGTGSALKRKNKKFGIR
jgi:hypothetical protein